MRRTPVDCCFKISLAGKSFAGVAAEVVTLSELGATAGIAFAGALEPASATEPPTSIASLLAIEPRKALRSSDTLVSLRICF